jgi:hypothetical protein
MAVLPRFLQIEFEPAGGYCLHRFWRTDKRRAARFQSIPFSGLLAAIKRVFEVVVPAKLKITTKSIPVAEVKKAWEHGLYSSRSNRRSEIASRSLLVQLRSVELSAHTPTLGSFLALPSAADGAAFLWEQLPDQNRTCSGKGCGSLDRFASSWPRTQF